MIVAVVTSATAFVVTLNVPLEAPTATDTVDGTEAEVVDDASLTEIAPLFDPGIALSVTTPEADAPPATEVGEIVKFVTSNGSTVRVVV